MKGFETNAYWEVLEHSASRVDEPTNPTFSTARAPTIPEEDGAYVPVKHKFDHTFGCPQFEGRVNMLQRFANGTIMKNKDGTAMAG